MPIRTALLGVVPPVVVALIVLAAGWRPWKAAPPAGRAGVISSALALALAYVVTDSLVAGAWPGFPPTSEPRWLPWLALAAAGAVAAFPVRDEARWSPHDLVALGAFTLLRWDALKAAPLYGALWVVMTTVLAGWMRVDSIRVGRCGPRVALTWCVVCIGGAVAYVQNDLAFVAQMSGALAAVMGVFAVLAFWRPKLELPAGMVPVFGVVFIGMTHATSAYATVESRVLLVLAGITPALAGTPLFAKARPWVATAACMALALALCVAAVWQSKNGFDFSGY